MKKKEDIKTQLNQQGYRNDIKGYPLYPGNEDIYSKSNEEKDMDPEDPSKMKSPNENGKAGEQNEKNFLEDMSGSDLDVPGSEADDNYKKVGNEDEENNYYSLGGDGHNNLEEDKG
jgi:hypothetical protein